MSLRPYKFIVQAVAQEVDKTGDVVAERPTEPVSLIGVAKTVEWIEAFPALLAEAEATTETPAAPNRAQRRARPKKRS